jgi:prepilin-type N-terminal cleavage/methylation domain-containing protein
LQKSAFTLIELIVVIAIIAILAAVVAPNAFKAVEKAKISRVTSDITIIKTAAMSFYSDTGLWPPDVCPNEDPGLVRTITYTTGTDRCCGQNDEYLPANFRTIIQNSWDGPYLEQFPRNTPWGGSYDWEYWPGGGWSQPPGTYVSVRPKWATIQLGEACIGEKPNPERTGVPPDFELKMQQQGIDEYHPSGVNTSDGTIIIRIMHF